MLIDLGVDFEDIKHLDEFEPLPNGTYAFTVDKVEAKEAKSGRPMLKWTLNITHDGADRKLFINAVLPWRPNGPDSEIDTGGCFTLVGITKSVGLPWTGQTIDTSAYEGRSGKAEVIQKPGRSQDPLSGEYVDDPDKPPTNDVKKWIY